MHEDLLGYLLNALDADEQQRMEERLAQDAGLRSELQKLRRCLEPMELLQSECPPPPDLADRTCELVAQHDPQNLSVPRSPREPHALAAAPHSVGFSPTEGVVMALVCLVAFTLFLPALANSRYQSRKTHCQDNMRELVEGLITFSEHQSDRSFPFVPLAGNRAFAGVFASKLVDKELLSQPCSSLVCPGSDLAREDLNWSVPTLDQVDRANGVYLMELQNRAAGAYAFSVGYFENGHYRAVQNQGRAHFALLADAPSYHLPGRMSANHGGRGQNICYEDGHIAFVTQPLDAIPDDPFRNRLGYAEVGVDRHDAAVLTSGTRPIVDTGSLQVIDSLSLPSEKVRWR